MKEEGRTELYELIELARHLGASDAKIISTEIVPVEDNLAKLCVEPRCENYGLSPGCPPHVSGPPGFRELLKEYKQALIIKIDVPSAILFSAERQEVFGLLHEIVAAVERSAFQMEYRSSRAYAGGSCKSIFCPEHPECRVLNEKNECRNPDSARPSMSGFGVNVSKLMLAAGWSMNRSERETGTVSMGTVCGLVLIG